MCKHSLEKIYAISEKEGSNKIAIVTNHLKIVGTLGEEANIDKDDYVLNLTEAKLWRLEDICTCKEPDCNCDEATFCSLDSLHINIPKVVGYSFIK